MTDNPVAEIIARAIAGIVNCTDPPCGKCVADALAIIAALEGAGYKVCHVIDYDEVDGMVKAGRITAE